MAADHSARDYTNMVLEALEQQGWSTYTDITDYIKSHYNIDGEVHGMVNDRLGSLVSEGRINSRIQYSLAGQESFATKKAIVHAAKKPKNCSQEVILSAIETLKDRYAPTLWEICDYIEKESQIPYMEIDHAVPKVLDDLEKMKSIVSYRGKYCLASGSKRRYPSDSDSDPDSKRRAIEATPLRSYRASPSNSGGRKLLGRSSGGSVFKPSTSGLALKSPRRLPSKTQGDRLKSTGSPVLPRNKSADAKGKEKLNVGGTSAADADTESFYRIEYDLLRARFKYFQSMVKKYVDALKGSLAEDKLTAVMDAIAIESIAGTDV